MLYIDGFLSTSSTNKWKAFSKFRIPFCIFGRKPKNIQKISEAWILIKLQCGICQWIHLNKFHKLMESFFSNFEFVFELMAENQKYSNE